MTRAPFTPPAISLVESTETPRETMTYEDFQHLARLYVVGALEADEITSFEAGRALFGSLADGYIRETRRFESAMALSLVPVAPRLDAKARLMSLLDASHALS